MNSESSFRDEPPPVADVEPADEPLSEPPPLLTAEDRQWGMLAHLSALIAGAVGGMTFVGPLIVWLIKKDQSRFVDYHGKEALNFQLNMLIYGLILVAVSVATCGVGRRPEDPVILSSYAASLAENKSRQARQIVEGTEFRRLFPGLTTRRDSRAVDHWELDGHKGGMLAVGVGGPITGHGARLGIIDDPVENWEQAQSQTIRDKTWEWYRTTFRTRIWEHGAIVLIMTRWHEDDLAGRLLAEQGDDWHVLRLPAIAETQADRDANNVRLGLPQGRSSRP